MTGSAPRAFINKNTLYSPELEKAYYDSFMEIPVYKFKIK